MPQQLDVQAAELVSCRDVGRDDVSARAKRSMDCRDTVKVFVLGRARRRKV